jgi:hypothetical protein
MRHPASMRLRNNNLANLNVFLPHESDFAFKAETARFLLKS